MGRENAQDRKRSAEGEIRWFTGQIEYHDAEASRLRKLREKHKARLKRAEAEISRQHAAKAYEKINQER